MVAKPICLYADRPLKKTCPLHRCERILALQVLRELHSSSIFDCAHFGPAAIGSVPPTREATLMGSAVNPVFRLEKLLASLGEDSGISDAACAKPGKEAMKKLRFLANFAPPFPEKMVRCISLTAFGSGPLNAVSFCWPRQRTTRCRRRDRTFRDPNSLGRFKRLFIDCECKMIGARDARSRYHRRALPGSFQHDALERCPFLRGRPWHESDSPQCFNATLPDLLAPDFRLHLPKWLFGSGRTRSNPGFFCHAT